MQVVDIWERVSLFVDVVCDYLFFFFFQAEDGIRDVAVTGVQTCALPIYRSSRTAWRIRRDPCLVESHVSYGSGLLFYPGIPAWNCFFGRRSALSNRHIDKIGRASCRERV